jgi:hypothetical protein
MQHFECGNTCWTWCGRPCLWEPEKTNSLLFHKDGRAKTLKERGLGWDDPAPPVPVVELTPDQRRTLAVLHKAVHGRDPNRPIPGTKTAGTETRNEKGFRSKGGRPKKAGALSAAERKALWKAKQQKRPVESGE